MPPTIGDTERRTDEQANDSLPQYRSEDGATFERPEARRAREVTICIVGLGYVGLPLAVGFARANYRVIGYDIDGEKVETLRSGTDTTGELSDADVANDGLSYTTDASTIADAEYVVVAVPTPIEDGDRPDLGFVESAARTVGEEMSEETTVILESTVYPGATREVFVPALEAASGLTAGEGFFVGYSPERATPGDADHELEDVVKVVSGQNDTVLEDVAALYESVVDAGVYRAPSIEVAEASKVVENAQRDLNIAFVNELSMAFERLDMDVHEVLEAAGTKWNFHAYRPGLVGGHCIPIDPHFLAYRSEREGFVPDLIRTGRRVNESVSEHVAELTIKALNRRRKTPRDSRVLVLGLAYKPGVGDVRSSKITDVIERLRAYGIDVAGYDPFVDPDVARESFDIDVQESLSFAGFDAVLLATSHAEFERLDLASVATDVAANPALIDVEGAFEESEAADAGFLYRRL